MPGPDYDEPGYLDDRSGLESTTFYQSAAGHLAAMLFDWCGPDNGPIYRRSWAQGFRIRSLWWQEVCLPDHGYFRVFCHHGPRYSEGKGKMVCRSFLPGRRVEFYP